MVRDWCGNCSKWNSVGFSFFGAGSGWRPSLSMRRDSLRRIAAKGTACRAPTDDGGRRGAAHGPLNHPGSATCWRAPTVDRYKHNQIRPPEGGRYRGNCLVAGAVVVELAAGGHCCERVAAGAELLVEGIVIYFVR